MKLLILSIFLFSAVAISAPALQISQASAAMGTNVLLKTSSFPLGAPRVWFRPDLGGAWVAAPVVSSTTSTVTVTVPLLTAGSPYRAIVKEGTAQVTSINTLAPSLPPRPKCQLNVLSEPELVGTRIAIPFTTSGFVQELRFNGTVIPLNSSNVWPTIEAGWRTLTLSVYGPGGMGQCQTRVQGITFSSSGSVPLPGVDPILDPMTPPINVNGAFEDELQGSPPPDAALFDNSVTYASLFHLLSIIPRALASELPPPAPFSFELKDLPYQVVYLPIPYKNSEPLKMGWETIISVNGTGGDFTIEGKKAVAMTKYTPYGDIAAGLNYYAGGKRVDKSPNTYTVSQVFLAGPPETRHAFLPEKIGTFYYQEITSAQREQVWRTLEWYMRKIKRPNALEEATRRMSAFDRQRLNTFAHEEQHRTHRQQFLERFARVVSDPRYETWIVTDTPIETIQEQIKKDQAIRIQRLFDVMRDCTSRFHAAELPKTGPLSYRRALTKCTEHLDDPHACDDADRTPPPGPFECDWPE